VIPLGSKLYVEGYGEGIAEDTGGAIRGEIIDLYMLDRNEALSWGRRQVEVRIIEEG
jgi:3D (Asp-Asp-Asp) domain-containing protein